MAEQHIKVVLVGETQTGKTALITRAIDDEFFAEGITTMVASMKGKKFTYLSGKAITLDIWDTAGQEKFRALNKVFYKSAVIAIMVYAIDSRKTFEEVKNYWYNEIKAHCINNPILAVVGNKSDLYAKEEVKEKEGKEFARSIGALFMLTSCLNNSNVTELFEHLGGIYLGEYSIRELNGDADGEEPNKGQPKVIDEQPKGVKLNDKQFSDDDRKDKCKC